MNTFDVLKRRGIRINFVAVFAVILIVIIAIVLFTCRSDGSKETAQNNSSSKSTVTQVEKKPVEKQPVEKKPVEKKQLEPRSNKTNDNTFDDYAGTSKLFKSYKFVGNSDTLVYHVTDGSCPAADKMNPDNIVKLNSKDDARKKGYNRCDICNP
jgi:hypothetical protein